MTITITTNTVITVFKHQFTVNLYKCDYLLSLSLSLSLLLASGKEYLEKKNCAKLSFNHAACERNFEKGIDQHDYSTVYSLKLLSPCIGKSICYLHVHVRGNYMAFIYGYRIILCLHCLLDLINQFIIYLHIDLSTYLSK